MSTVVELNSASRGSDSVLQVNATQPQTSSQSTPEAFPSNAVLQRMKELERMLQESQSENDAYKTSTSKCQERITDLEALIAELNADKVQEMKTILNTGVNEWLDSLNISEDMKKQVRVGIESTIEKGNVKDQAWNIVCNASQTHRKQLDKIEELVQQCNSKDKTIEELLKSRDDPSFSSAHSRISNAVKRHLPSESLSADPKTTTSVDQDHAHVSKKQHTSNGDAWDIFSGMITNDSRNVYF